MKETGSVTKEGAAKVRQLRVLLAGLDQWAKELIEAGGIDNLHENGYYLQRENLRLWAEQLVAHNENYVDPETVIG